MTVEQENAINNYLACQKRKTQAVLQATREKRELTEREKQELLNAINNAYQKCITLGLAPSNGTFAVKDNQIDYSKTTITPPITENRTDVLENRDNNKLLEIAKSTENAVYERVREETDELKQSSQFRDLSIKENNLYYNNVLPEYLQIDLDNDTTQVIEAKKEAILKWYVNQSANDIVDEVLENTPEYQELSIEDKQAVRNNTDSYAEQILDYSSVKNSSELPENIQQYPELWTHINKTRLDTVADTLSSYVKKDYQDSVQAALQNGKMLDGREINEIISNSIEKHINSSIPNYTEDEKTYVKYKLQETRGFLNNLYNDFLNKVNVNKETSSTRAANQRSASSNKEKAKNNKNKPKILPDYWSKSNVSFSGSDMVVSADIKTTNGQTISVVVGSVQTISYSIYRKLSPIYCIGNVNAKDYVGGPRTIAGSIVFTVFNQHWGTELTNRFFEAEGYAANRKILMDEIAPINFTITFANEYGICSRLAIYSVRLFSEGQVMSINDIFTENTYQYVALNIDYLVDMNSNAFKSEGKIVNKLDLENQSAPNNVNYGTPKITNMPEDTDEENKTENDKNQSTSQSKNDNVPRDMYDNVIDCSKINRGQATKILVDSYKKYIKELQNKMTPDAYKKALEEVEKKYNNNSNKIKKYYSDKETDNMPWYGEDELDNYTEIETKK